MNATNLKECNGLPFSPGYTYLCGSCHNITSVPYYTQVLCDVVGMNAGPYAHKAEVIFSKPALQPGIFGYFQLA